MTKRIPKDATPDERLSWHLIFDELNKIKTENVDLNKRRFLNAHPAISRGDFITKGQFDDAIDTINTTTKKTTAQVTAVSSGVVSSGGGGTGSFPAANHPIDFGFYFVDSKYGQYEGDVKGFTNLAYIGPNNMLDSGAAQSDVKAAFALGIARLTAAGLNVVLDVERGTILTVGGALEAAAPYWAKVKYVVAAGAWDSDLATLDALCVQIKNSIANLGLAARPVGIVNDGTVFIGNSWWTAPNLDFVVLEAYSPDPNSHGTSKANTDLVTATVNRLKSQVPAGKNLGIIFQTYDRNGVFTPITPDLVDMQGASYLLGNQDTRVVFMLMFAYGRPGGAKDHPELLAPLKGIWSAIQGATGTTTGGGGGTPPPGTGSGATDCGQGRTCCGGVTGVNCPRWCDGGDWQNQLFSAQGAYIIAAPASVIDPANLTHVLDAPTYMAGIVAQFNVDNPTLIAMVEPGNDGKQIEVKSKGDATKSEHYKCWNGGGDNTYVRYLYAASCYPARFEG